jgi:hypothetical protein
MLAVVTFLSACDPRERQQKPKVAPSSAIVLIVTAARQ